MKPSQPEFQIKRIVAATDFSACATRAFEYAKMLARRFESEITLLHAVVLKPLSAAPQSTGAIPGPGLAVDLTSATAAQENAAGAVLEEYRDAHSDGVGALSTLLAAGDPANTILTRSGEADLIVIGTSGRSGIKRLLLGSVAEEVIRKSQRPVLAVRCSEENQQPALKRILCPVNYTAVAGDAFRRAVYLASAFNAELIVLHLIEKDSHDGEQSDLERLRGWIGEFSPAVSTYVLVRTGEAAGQVNQYTTQNHVDLIVLGARQKKSGKQSVLGSTTDKVTHHAPCPVLVVPAGSARFASQRVPARLKRGGHQKKHGRARDPGRSR